MLAATHECESSYVQFAIRIDDSKSAGTVFSFAMRSLKAEGYRGESGNFVRG